MCSGENKPVTLICLTQTCNDVHHISHNYTFFYVYSTDTTLTICSYFIPCLVIKSAKVNDKQTANCCKNIYCCVSLLFLHNNTPRRIGFIDAKKKESAWIFRTIDLEIENKNKITSTM